MLQISHRTQLCALILFGGLAVSCGTTGAAPAVTAPSVEGGRPGSRSETVLDLGQRIPESGARTQAEVRVRLERVSGAVPWPRGLAWVDDELVVLARGRHRRAGGLDHSIEDWAGSLFRVDPDVSEPVVPGVSAGAAVANNAKLFARAAGWPFNLPDRSLAPVDDHRMDRPYCTLIYDDESRNLFICGYSGVDLTEKRFRKNATDSIHRYDLRAGSWFPVEMHDPNVVSSEELGYVVSNTHYPHHDPEESAAPHGWLNGPDGGCVAGDYLYATAKDNHLLVQYDLDAVREDPGAGYPESRPVLDSRIRVSYPGGEEEIDVRGHCAAATWGDHLYIGFRTSSIVLRFPLQEDGDLVRPVVGELVAAFEPWDDQRKRSANLIDMAFNGKGELFVSCAQEGRIWKVGTPDPAHPFYGNDQGARPTTTAPYIDLAQLAGQSSGTGNILFDDQDRLYICAGNYDTQGSRFAGVIYRAVEVSQEAHSTAGL